VAKFGKDPIYRTKVIVRKPVWTPDIPNHIIWPVSRRVCKNDPDLQNVKFLDRIISTDGQKVAKRVIYVEHLLF
jgi:hypothetical protein